MLNQCSHKFLWPQRSPDGHYYQACLLCRTEYEYDWESMQRLRRQDMGSAVVISTEIGSTDTAGTEDVRTATAVAPDPEPEISALEAVVHSDGAQVVSGIALEPPPPRLLFETEQRHRVFIRNLVDLYRDRSLPKTATTSTPGPIWNDIFVSSGLPWRWFAESMLGHLIVITALLILVPKWPSGPIQKPTVFRSPYVSYYAPPKAFPALRSHTPRVHRPAEPVHRPALRVAQERAPGSGQKPAMTLPPDRISGKRGGLKMGIPASAAPMMPLTATGGSRNVPAGPTWVVAPPPDSSAAAARRSGLLQATAIAPVPEVDGISSRRGSATSGPHASVVAPAPSLAGSIRRAGSVNIGESAVVNPAPVLPMEEQSAVSALVKGTLGGMGSAVVPPPPSVQSAGNLPGGRASLLSGNGSQVVPPTPSMQGASNTAGGVRGNALSPDGWQVVPPTPSVPGGNNETGNGRGSSLSSGLQAVPPPPSMPGDGTGSGAGTGRANSLSGAAVQGVPPAPGVQGGGGGGGRGNSLSAGVEGLPPGSGEGSSGQGTSGQGSSGQGSSGQGISGQGSSGQASSGQGNGAAAGGVGSTSGEGLKDGKSGTSSSAAIPPEPPTMEMPLRLIAPVLALPGSTYFSNYEVFIAERRIGKGQSQFIKLVYTSLPYQRRLAEYGPNYSMVYKLRVTRDKACDESLLQMTWPETDPRPDAQHPGDSPALSSQDRNGMLPCYTTTADDYRRAIAQKH